jgi:hypothetical protein
VVPARNPALGREAKAVGLQDPVSKKTKIIKKERHKPPELTQEMCNAAWSTVPA